MQPAHAEGPAATPTRALGESWTHLVESSHLLQEGVSAFVTALGRFKDSDTGSDGPPQPCGERLSAPRVSTQCPMMYPCRAGSTTPGPPSADRATRSPGPAPHVSPAADEATPDGSPLLPVSTHEQPNPSDQLHHTLLAEALRLNPSAAAAVSSDLPERAQPEPYGCHPDDADPEPGEPQPAGENKEPAVHHSGEPREERAAEQQPETRRPQSDAPQPAKATDEPLEDQLDEAVHVLEEAPDRQAKGQPAMANEEPTEQQHAKAEEESGTQKNGQPDPRQLETRVAAQHLRCPDTQQPEKAIPQPGGLAPDGVPYRPFPAQTKQGPIQPEIAKAEPGLPTPGTGRRDAGATREGATEDEDPEAQRQLSNTSAQTPCFGSPGSAVPPLGLGLPDVPQRPPSAAATSTIVHVAGGLHYNECLTMGMEDAQAIRSSATHL